ncbi:MAG: hypothetical protein GY859_02060 [Desulfobacterales bacterium]|nr:hypothetical protein [Desulfobacterales bacterium]
MNQGITFAWAESAEEKEKAAALQRKIYCDEVHPQLVRDAENNGKLVIARVQDTIIGCMRVTLKRPFEIEKFIEITELSGENIACEVGRLAVLPEYRVNTVFKRAAKKLFTEGTVLQRVRRLYGFLFDSRQRKGVLLDNHITFGLFKFLYLYSKRFNVDFLYMLSTEKKRGLYEMLGGKVVGKRREHSLTKRIVHPMMCRVKHGEAVLKKSKREIYDFLNSNTINTVNNFRLTNAG